MARRSARPWGSRSQGRGRLTGPERLDQGRHRSRGPHQLDSLIGAVPQAVLVDQHLLVSGREPEPTVLGIGRRVVHLEEARHGLVLEPLLHVARMGAGPGGHVARCRPPAARERTIQAEALAEVQGQELEGPDRVLPQAFDELVGVHDSDSPAVVTGEPGSPGTGSEPAEPPDPRTVGLPVRGGRHGWRRGAVGDRQPAGDRGPPARRRPDLERAAQRGEPVLHVPESLAGPDRGRVEPTSVVPNREHHLPVLLADGHGRPRGVGVLRHVLQGLEAAEVGGGLRLGRVPAEGADLEGNGQGGLGQVGLDGGGQPLVGEQWRVDPPGQIAQVLERVVGVGGELAEQVRGPSGSVAAICWISFEVTAIATRCCWAPSWMLRSSLRAAASWAATIR